MFSLFDFEITTKKLLLLLAPFDLFKQNVSLKLHSNFRVSLTIGKIFSFAVIVFMLYNFVESDMVQRTNPIVLQQSFEEDQRLTLNFTSKNILMVFGVTDDYNLIYDDPTIFNITSSKVIVVNGSKSTFIDSKLEKCKTNHFERYPDFLTKMNMNGTKCLSDDFNLQGFWDESYLEFFVIEVKKCQNSSFSSIVCKSNEEIVNYMKGKFFSQWVEQKRFDVKNPDNPISGKIKNYYNAYQPGQTKSTRFFLKKVKLITDSGIIFSSSTEENSFALDKLEYDVTPSETHFFTFVAYASDNSLTIERRYEKLFDLFASLGGLLNVLFIVASMIVEFIHDWKLNELVLNKLYVFINSNQKRLNKAISKIPMNFASSRVAPTSKRQINIDRNSMSLNVEYQNKLSMTLYEKTKLFFRKCLRKKNYIMITAKKRMLN